MRLVTGSPNSRAGVGIVNKKKKIEQPTRATQISTPITGGVAAVGAALVVVPILVGNETLDFRRKKNSVPSLVLLVSPRGRVEKFNL